MPTPRFQPVTLPYNRAVATSDGARSTGGFDDAGRALPSEMLPDTITYGGIQFALAPAGANTPDAVVAQGQTLSLPAGSFTRVYVLAASADGDQQATFRVGNIPTTVTVQDWSGFIGQWDDRLWKTVELPPPAEPATDDSTLAQALAQARQRLNETIDTSRAAQRTRRILARIRERGPITREEYAGLVPGFIKRAPVAWFASHRHTPEGANEAYAYSYLFAYALDVPSGARTLTLPTNHNVRVLAVTVAEEPPSVEAAQPLYDVLGRRSGG